MRRLVFFLCLIISNLSHSQVDPAKADSLAKSIASKQKKLQSFQDSFIKVQESTYHSEVAKSLQETNQDTSLTAKEKHEEQRRERQLYIRLGIAALLLVLLVIGLLRIRNKSKQS